MDMLNSNIIIIDDNDTELREQVLSKIIAAALLEQLQLHKDTLKKNGEVKGCWE